MLGDVAVVNLQLRFQYANLGGAREIHEWNYRLIFSVQASALW